MIKTLCFPLIIFVLMFSALSNAAGPITNHSFKSHQDKDFQLYDLKGNYLLVSFVYTRCPISTMCPLTISLNKRVLAMSRKSLPKVPLRFLIVTLDPTHDTPAKLREYAKTHGATDPSFVFATGNEKTIDAFSSEFNAIGFPAGGFISHNSRSVLLAPDLAFITDYKDNEWKPEDVLKDLKRVSTQKEKNRS